MNRKQRRAEGWDKLNPRLPYTGLIADVGNDASTIMLSLLRNMFSAEFPGSDEELWDGTRELINRGFLDVYFRFDGEKAYVMPELHFETLEEIEVTLQ